MNKIINKLKSLDIGTIVRTVLQLLAYANQALALIKPFEWSNNAVYQWISFGVSLAITAITYWYNNDWSSLSILTRDIFDMLKDGKISKEEAEAFIDKHKKESK